MAVCGCVWQCVAVYGSVWLCMAVCGSVWLCVAVCGCAWQCVWQLVHGSVWLCMAVCGCAWQCVAVRGSVWLCMAVCGCAGQCVWQLVYGCGIVSFSHRRELQHFVDVMHGYITNQLFYLSWGELEDDLASKVSSPAPSPHLPLTSLSPPSRSSLSHFSLAPLSTTFPSPPSQVHSLDDLITAHQNFIDKAIFR